MKHFFTILQFITFLFVTNMSLLAQDVLIIYDDSPTNTNTISLRNALQSAGFSVTISSVSETSWNNTNPSLSGFDAVIHLNGTTYASGMPSAGQNALVNYVQNNHGLYIGFEWNAYEHDATGSMAAMTNLILFTRSSGTDASMTHTIASGQSSHPVLNGISSFSITGGHNVGSQRSFSSQPSTVLMNVGSNPAVAVRDYGNGHVLNFHSSGNYQSQTILSNSSIKQIIINFINAYHCVNITPSATNVLCNGASTGSISLTVSGGTTPYSYSWNTGSTASSISGLTAGTYTVTVTDNTSCSSTATQTITQPTTALVANTTSTNVVCNGQSNGAITSIATGGVSPYTRLWNTGSTATSLTSLTVGTYTVTITDNNACTATKTTAITQPAALVASTGSVTNVTCAGSNNGAITITVAGGTTPYVYSWSNGGSSATISSLAAGTYTVTVTDNSGCVDAETIVLPNPSAFSATISSTTNVTCNAGANGAATASASGGQSPYTYVWSNGATGSTVNGLTAGNYTLTVTDNFGCTDTEVMSITQPTAMSVSMTLTNATCNGINNGSIVASATGGTGPYTYLWSTGATGNTANSLTGGTYNVTATSSNGCTKTQSATITQPGAITLNINKVNISCNGLNDGTATASASGGVSPYTYAWSNGATSAAISSLAIGTYTVTTTANNGCTKTASTTVTQPTALAAAIGSVSNSCSGASSGSATASASGGVSPYTYLWSTGSTTAALNGLSAANYTVTVTDNNGCTDTELVTITQPASVVASISASSNLTCFGAANGSATASASGGSGPFGYAWNNGASTAANTSLSAGTYTVTVSNSNGCTSTATVALTQPANIVIPTISRVSVTCNGGSNGSLTVNPSGGSSPYSYLWSNGVNSQSNTGLTAGNYTVTVTDNIGCTKTASRNMNQPAVVNTTVTGSNVSCFNGNNGSATASTSGGTSPFSYTWSTATTGSTITGRTAGTYFVTTTDNNGCTDIESITLTQPNTISASIGSATNITCNGGNNGSASATVSGGIPNYTFAWSSGGASSAISSMAAGIYTVTVTDANACTKTAVATLTQPSAVVAGIAASNNATCSGTSTGSAIASASGGNSPYSYLWSNTASTMSITSLAAGTYTVTVTDNSGCTDSESVTISQPAVLSASTAVSTAISCNGGNNGAASASATGGTSPYNYAWNNGSTSSTTNTLTAGTYTVTVTDNNGCTDTEIRTMTQPNTLIASIGSIVNVACFNGANGSALASSSGGTGSKTYSWIGGGSSATKSALTAGTYTVIVTDANGCTDSESVTITQPTALALSVASSSNALCNGQNNGTLAFASSGGTSPYSYAWNTGGTNASNSNLTAGNYTVTVTDNNGCTQSQNATITQPSVLVASTTIGNNVSCFGGGNGSASASGTGGTYPYTYLWSNGGSTSGIGSLSAGSYSVTLTDNNGCTDSESITVTQPTNLSVTLTPSAVLCFGGNSGSAVAAGSGGTSPYTYIWSNAANTASASGLTAGTYTVTTTDNNGCTSTQFTIITQPSDLSVALTGTNINCFNESNGNVVSVANGGTTPYSYLWNNGDTSVTAANLTAGNYTVTITDNNGCTETASTTLTEPTLLILSTSLISNPSCFQFDDGEAEASASGSVPPYEFNWSNGDIGTLANELSQGTYTVTLTDNNGCFAIDTVSLIHPTLLVSSIISVDHVNCFAGQDGSAVAEASGATAPYQFAWSNGDTADTANVLSAGTYMLTIIDAQGCIALDTAVITQPDSLTLSISTVPVTCFGGTDAGATSEVSGGVEPYGYSWSNGEVTDTLVQIPAGIYSLVVTDSHGCVITDSATISYLYELPYVSLGADTTICEHDAYLLEASDSSNFGSMMLWSTGDTTTGISITTTDTFWVVATDSHGCVHSDTVYVRASDCLGVDEMVEHNNWILYPNPTLNSIYISSQKIAEGEFNIVLTDAQGAIKKHMSDQHIQSGVPIKIDLEELAAGIYFIRISNDRSSAVKQFVIQ